MHLAEHVLSCKSGILMCRTICTAALSISYMLFEEVLPQRSNPQVTDLVVPWMCCYGISSVVRSSCANPPVSFASTYRSICLAKVAICALLVKIRALVRAVSLRREEIDFEEDRFDKSSSEAKLLKHRKNLQRTARTIQGTPNFDVSLHMYAVHGSTFTACY